MKEYKITYTLVSGKEVTEIMAARNTDELCEKVYENMEEYEMYSIEKGEDSIEVINVESIEMFKVELNAHEKKYI